MKGQDEGAKGCPERAKPPPTILQLFINQIIEMMLEGFPGGSTCTEAEKASQNGPIMKAKDCRNRAMAPQGSQKGAKKQTEFTEKAHFWDSCAQGIIRACFLSNSEAVYTRNATEIPLSAPFPRLSRKWKSSLRLRRRKPIEDRTF